MNKPQKPREDLWVWLDLEMTGLEPHKDQIIEIASIVTDYDLNILAEGPVLAISATDALLDSMDEWCTRTHGESGLTERVRASQVSLAEAEAQTLAFLNQWVVPGSSPLCGNSICQDRRFLWQQMPKLEAFFNYRNLDVSSLKILAQTWKPAVKMEKQSTHLALDDIRESIAELRLYKDQLLKL